MNIFVERFLPLIESSGKSEQELEKAMGLPRSIIYDWKNGRNKSSFMKYAGNFAVYFGVSADYILGLTDNPALHSKVFPPTKSALKVCPKMRFTSSTLNTSNRFWSAIVSF